MFLLLFDVFLKTDPFLLRLLELALFNSFFFFLLFSSFSIRAYHVLVAFILFPILINSVFLSLTPISFLSATNFSFSSPLSLCKFILELLYQYICTDFCLFLFILEYSYQRGMSAHFEYLENQRRCFKLTKIFKGKLTRMSKQASCLGVTQVISEALQCALCDCLFLGSLSKYHFIQICHSSRQMRIHAISMLFQSENRVEKTFLPVNEIKEGLSTKMVTPKENFTNIFKNLEGML